MEERDEGQQTAAMEIGRRAIARADAVQLAEWATDALADHLDADHAAVFTLTSVEGLSLRAGVGWDPEVGRTAAVSADEPLLAAALRSEQPVLCSGIDEGRPRERRVLDPQRHGAPASGSRRLPPRGAGINGIAMAIRGRGGPAGVLAAYRYGGRRFGPEDAEVIRSVAELLSEVERDQEEELLTRREALIDPLTGKPNRALFMDRLGEALLRAQSSGTDLAVLVVDLDDLRLINDVSGSEVGDGLLREFVPRIRRALAITDTVARIGGDEFAVLCESPGSSDRAVAVAERILDSLDEAFEVGAARYRVSACVGVAHYPDRAPEAGADALLRRASVAVRRARERGKGSIELFAPGIERDLRTRLGIGQALREAPARGELSIAVQPIYFLAARVVHSTEVLLRWDHPELGSISPAEFIPIAEENGTIDEIGGWVLDEACALAARWRADDVARKLLPLNVNISPLQLRRPNFVARVAEALARVGASPRDLGLEITERAVLPDQEVSAARLAELRAMGVSILLDDFGTGYSSLTHLKQLPIDVVKIDRSFISGATTTERRDSAIVNAITSIAGAFVIQVVAEGVETEDQIETLRCLGCLLGQGYHLCAPTDPDALVAAVAERSSPLGEGGSHAPVP